MATRASLAMAITARIAAVDPVASAAGTIHNRERYIQSGQPWADAFKGTLDHVQGWWLTWDRIENEWDADGSAFGAPARLYLMTVWHVSAVDDEQDTYSSHLDRAEALGDDIMARQDLGVAGVIDFGVKVNSIENDTVFLGDYLLWRSAIEIVIPVRLSVSYA